MEIYIEFINILKTYTNIFYKNMLFRYIKTPKYLEFIYLKGLFLLKNIYILLLINCVNNSEIKAIIEKAYIYFIEFLIQININYDNFELTLKDATMFTYKKTIMSYKQTNFDRNILNNDIDNKLNILCNIFYITNNANFIECMKNEHTDEANYTNLLITNKIHSIKTMENKLLKLITNNNELSELNNKLLETRDNMEKTIDILYTNTNTIETANYNINMINTIHIMLDSYI